MGLVGIEPMLVDLESSVLPLHYNPNLLVILTTTTTNWYFTNNSNKNDIEIIIA